MSPLVILLIVVILIAVGGLPQLGWHSMGYGPSGVSLVLVVVLIILLLR